MSGPDRDDLSERIAKAKAHREEAELSRKKRRREDISQPAGMALRYSSELVASVLVGVVLGLVIDHFARTSPWGLIIMMGFGMAAGIRNLMRAAKRINEEAAAAAAKDESNKETRE